MGKPLIARSRMSKRRLAPLIDVFILEVPAVKAACLLDISRHSASRAYQVICQHLVQECTWRSHLHGDVKADESYFRRYHKAFLGRGQAESETTYRSDHLENWLLLSGLNYINAHYRYMAERSMRTFTS
jgi:hypothetical protein